MNDQTLKLHGNWSDYGVTLEWLKEKSEWMRRECGAPRAIDGFFDVAGKLFLYCGYDFHLLAAMFYHAVIGLEGMLRVHYEATEKDRFSELLSKAVSEGLIHDGIFTEIRPFLYPEIFEMKIGKGRQTHAQKLAVLLPLLRNEYVHGEYQFTPDYLFLAIQVREAADVLTMPRTPQWKMAGR